MEYLYALDFSALFIPKMSLLEIILRGTIAYLGLCVLLRIIPKRQIGRSSISDILFVVLIGGITVDPLTKRAESLTDWFLMLATILLLSYACNALGYRFRWFRMLIQEPPTCLIRGGVILKGNLRREMISEEDLMRELRREGVENPAHVLEAHLEADGEISVVKKQGFFSRKSLTSPKVECGDQPVMS